jgi:hypothetical protein
MGPPGDSSSAAVANDGLPADDWDQAIAAAVSAAPKPGTALCETVGGLLGPALSQALKDKATAEESK